MINQVLNKFKILKLLDRKEKKNLFYLVIILLVATLLETTGIGVIYPLIKIIVAEDIFSIHPILSDLLVIFNIENKNKAILIYIFLLIAFFIFKNFYLLFSIYQINKFVINFQNRISELSYSKNINMDYSFFLNNETSEIIKNQTQEINRTALSLFTFINLLGDSAIFICIAILLLFIDFQITIYLIAGLVFIMFIYYFLVKKRLLFWGKVISNSYKEITDNLLQIFSNIKYVKLINLNNLFIRDYIQNYKNYTVHLLKNKIISQTPKLWLEIIAIGIVCIILLNSFYTQNINDVIALIGLLSFALTKLIPTIYRLISGYQLLLFQNSALDNIFEINNTENFHVQKGIKEEKKKFFTKLKINNVSFYYSKNKQVLENINLELSNNEKIAILGPSGSGKSTLLDLMTGLLKPKTGNIEILFDNKSLGNDQFEYFKNKTSYVCQSSNLFNGNAIFNITFSNHDQVNKKLLNEISDLLDIRELLSGYQDKKIGEFGSNISGGQKQKISLARALYRKPQVLILDEATSALDEETEMSILKKIYKLNLTIIHVTHNKSLLDIVDKYFDLSKKVLINNEISNNKR